MENISERGKWFRERVGRVVWRTDTGCLCEVCKGVYANGVKIEDVRHAGYLQDLEADYAAGGDVLRYFDTKEERDVFEKSELRKAVDRRIAIINLTEEEMVKRSDKLWKKLVKDLKGLQDNNYTARLLFDYVERHYA